MSPGHFLAKRHGIVEYLSVTHAPPSGFVYVETDRYLPRPVPDGSLEKWAKEPLEEVRFLRRVVEGKTQEGDGVDGDTGQMMKGCVLWAPLHLSAKEFEEYLRLVEGVAGPELWERVRGFRYLLQGKKEGEVERIVGTGDWVRNVGRLGARWAFDVGVDVHRDGEGGLEAVWEMVREVRREGGEGVRFVLSKSFTFVHAIGKMGVG